MALTTIAPGPMSMSEKIVTIKYSDLTAKRADVSEKLEAGFGLSGLGIIAVADVPEYPRLRERLLPLAQRVANLPEEVKKELEDPASRYSYGWSHGKEKLESGQPDLLKGSFYANLCKDRSGASTELMQRYPTQCRNNLWPKKGLPELEAAVKELGSLIIGVGILLAYHCDKYVSSKDPGSKVASLESLLQRSQCHKGRLLHYFPKLQRHSGDEESAWCGWHRDISCLTGLASAIYTKGELEVASPDPEAGLYIKNRAGNSVKALYDASSLAFQLGEAAEILSGGTLHPTPHYVKAPKQEGLGVARNSFAVFMQPHWDESLYVPEAMHNSDGVKELPSELGNFGDFSEMKLLNYNFDPGQGER